MTFREFIRGKGYKLVDSEYYNHISHWQAWYRGRVDGFHGYNIYNSGKAIKRQRATLRMAKQGCEYWANLLWNDECTISAADDAVQNRLMDALQANDFWRQTNKLTEQSFALGTGAYVVFRDGDMTRIEYLTAPYIYPIEWRGDEVISCALVGERVWQKKRLLYVMIHERQPGGQYKVYNMFFERTDATANITPVEPPEGIQPEYITAVPRFAILRPNIANNIDCVPLGMSVYANCIDVLKSIDLAYDGAKTAMEIGRPRIGVSSNAFNVDIESGERRKVFDANDIAVYDIGAAGDMDKVQVEDLTTSYRATEYETSLQTQLNIYSQAIGLGDKAFKWSQESIATATQVVAENSAMLRTMEKHQTGLRSAITQLCRAVLDAEGLSPDVDIAVAFDDSVTRDRNADRMRFWQYVQAGKFPFARFLQEYEGYSQEDAEAIAQTEQTNGEMMGFSDA